MSNEHLFLLESALTEPQIKLDTALRSWGSRRRICELAEYFPQVDFLSPFIFLAKYMGESDGEHIRDSEFRSAILKVYKILISIAARNFEAHQTTPSIPATQS